MPQHQTAQFETKAPVQEDLAPLTAPPTWFPGALPREIMKQLKEVDRDLSLKWSPRYKCWEVWHNCNFQEYCFYRHSGPNGEFLHADKSLIMEVKQRAMWTPEGQELLRRQMNEAYYAATNTETGRDPDKVAWQSRKERER